MQDIYNIKLLVSTKEHPQKPSKAWITCLVFMVLFVGVPIMIAISSNFESDILGIILMYVYLIIFGGSCALLIYNTTCNMIK